MGPEHAHLLKERAAHRADATRALRVVEGDLKLDLLSRPVDILFEVRFNLGIRGTSQASVGLESGCISESPLCSCPLEVLLDDEHVSELGERFLVHFETHLQHVVDLDSEISFLPEEGRTAALRESEGEGHFVLLRTQDLRHHFGEGTGEGDSLQREMRRSVADLVGPQMERKCTHLELLLDLEVDGARDGLRAGLLAVVEGEGEIHVRVPGAHLFRAHSFFSVLSINLMPRFKTNLSNKCTPGIGASSPSQPPSPPSFSVPPPYPRVRGRHHRRYPGVPAPQLRVSSSSGPPSSGSPSAMFLSRLYLRLDNRGRSSDWLPLLPGRASSLKPKAN